jgi:hypothetical protein
VPALADLVEVNEVVIRPLCPAPRGLVVLAGKDADGRRDRDVSVVVKAELISQYRRAEETPVPVSQ